MDQPARRNPLLHRLSTCLAALFAPLLLPALALALAAGACDARAKDGAPCAKPEDCAQGLTCASDKCAPPAAAKASLEAEREAHNARATREDCSKVYDAMIRSETEGEPAAVVEMTKALMEGENRTDFVRACEGSLRLKEAQCYQRAKTRAEYQACKSP